MMGKTPTTRTGVSGHVACYAGWESIHSYRPEFPRLLVASGSYSSPDTGLLNEGRPVPNPLRELSAPSHLAEDRRPAPAWGKTV